MLNSNPNFDRSNSPDRPAGGAPGYAPPRAPADSAETRIPVLGKTLLFRGELTAEEDVILQGRVEGSIRHARNLIIGTDGSVLGDVYANARVLSEDYDTTGRIMKVRGLPGAIARLRRTLAAS